MFQPQKFDFQTLRGNTPETAVYRTACVFLLMERVLTDYLRKFRLTPAKFNTLMVVKHIGRESGLSQIEIGRRLIVTASNMTRLLDKLQKEGYLRRGAQKGDRRVNNVLITEKGINVLDNAWPGYHARIQHMANMLEKKELQLISSVTAKWIDRLEKKETH